MTLGVGEVFVIVLVAVVVLGPERLPSAIRKLSEVLREVREIAGQFREASESVLDLTTSATGSTKASALAVDQVPSSTANLPPGQSPIQDLVKRPDANPDPQPQRRSDLNRFRPIDDSTGV